MKARMKKLEILCPENMVKPLLQDLRDLECLHFEALEEKINFLENPAYKQFHQAYKLVSENSEEEKHNPVDKPKTLNLRELSQSILDLEKKLKSLEGQLSRIDKKLELKEIWGDFKAHKWHELAQAGLEIRFYATASNRLEKMIKEGFKPILLKENNAQSYFARIISSADHDDFMLEPLEIPTESISSLVKEKEQIKSHLAQAQKDLKEAAKHRQSLKSQTLNLQDQLIKERIVAQSYQVKAINISHIKCWYKDSNENLIKQLLNKESVAYQISQAVVNDPVPVLLNNNKFNKLFEPVTKIFQLPHYFEFDLTPFIAVFYPILFAYCLGDAGYGFLLSMASLWAYFSFLKKQRSLALLGLILGLSTLVMGFIKSGSLFGIPLLTSSSHPWVQQLSKLVLIPDDSDYFFNAFNVALLIGLLQIVVGIVIAIFKTWSYKGFWSALAQIGKMLIVLSSVSLFLNETLQLSAVLMLGLKLILAGGILMVMFFHDMSQHLFSRLGSSVLPLFFIFTGLLGDVLSYVRLFALGVTSGVLGLVVNQIGTDMIGDSWFSYLGAIAFLIFGHALNLALAVLGSFIHPLRLTFVEFYNNAQFEGGGKAFEAYTKSIKIN